MRSSTSLGALWRSGKLAMRVVLVTLPMLAALALSLALSLAPRAANARVLPKKTGRSVTVANAHGTTLLLDQMRLEDQRRRDDILRLELEWSRRERSDRVVIFGVVAIAATAVIVVEKARRRAR